MENLLLINHIQKEFSGKKVLSDIDLQIKKGEIYGLIGNNGAGKTTLLRIICGMIKPTTGNIEICEDSAKENENCSKCSFLRKLKIFSKKGKSKIKIGSLIESPGLYFDMSAYQNLKALSICLGIKQSKAQIKNLLKLVGLESVGKKKTQVFSMGMKQRLGIALALLGEPDLLILDEPNNSLDPQGILEIRNLILKIHKERNITIIVSSHILDELAKIATRYCIIHHGTILKEETSAELFEECGELPIDEYYMKILAEADKEQEARAAKNKPKNSKK